MNCSNCDDNYLRKIFNSCMIKYVNPSDALIEFDKIIYNSKDPRNSLTIISAMYRNDCNNCKKYKCYYKDYIKKFNEEG